MNEDVTLLAFSPLAAGFLTGKIRAAPCHLPPDEPGARDGRPERPRVQGAVAAYLEIAAHHGLDPVHMAMAWQGTRPFRSIPIFGKPPFTQLERPGRIDLRLTPEVLAAISAAHRAHPMPY